MTRYADNVLMAEFDLSWKTKTAFVTTGIFIGMLVTIQIKSSIPTSSYLYDEMEVQQQLIKSYLDDQALLKSKIVSLRQRIDENQAKLSESKNNGSLEVLQSLKADVGLDVSRGSGVEITLNDGAKAQRANETELGNYLVNAADLRDLINLLRTTKARAIAINGQRIITSSPISSVGNTILVNNFHLLPPFNITAIGDSTVMMQILNDSTSLPDLYKRAKNKQILLEYKAEENMTAPVYNGDLRLKYIKQTIKTNP